jgi:predicted DNA-binding protein
MGVISIRLNKNEESILKRLTDLFDRDRSSVIKDILLEKYEDMQDLNVIKRFEKEEKNGKTSFVSAENILKEI